MKVTITVTGELRDDATMIDATGSLMELVDHVTDLLYDIDDLEIDEVTIVPNRTRDW